MPSCFSRVRLFGTPWTTAYQAPLSIGFSRQEYWSNGLSCPPPGDLPNPGIKPVSPVSPALQVGSLPLNHWGSLQQKHMSAQTPQCALQAHRKRALHCCLASGLNPTPVTHSEESPGGWHLLQLHQHSPGGPFPSHIACPGL